MSDWLAALKAKPGDTTFGTAGVGSGGLAWGGSPMKPAPRSRTAYIAYQAARAAIIGGLSRAIADIVPQSLTDNG